MQKVYQTQKNAHKFVFMSEMNDFIKEEVGKPEKPLKTYGKFVKFIGKEELFYCFAQHSSLTNEKIVFQLNEIKNCLVDISSISQSKIALFEDEGNYIIADLSNINYSKMDLKLAFMLFGVFKRVENNIPIFFVHVLSSTGDKDKGMIKQIIKIINNQSNPPITESKAITS